MPEELDMQWRILKTLEDISGKLDTLILLSKVGQKKELALLKDQILGRSKVRRKLYDLCNGELTINEIARLLNQKLPNISVEISYLEDSGLIIIKRIGKNKYPQRTIL